MVQGNIVTLITIFLLAFLLNSIWEELHSVLYVHYKGETITHLILLRAALFDASFITLVSLPFVLVRHWRRHAYLIGFVGIIFAVVLEHWALGMGRWAYANTMPIVPLLESGLTPTIQLGLLGYLSFCGVSSTQDA